MLQTYAECLKELGTKYNINKHITEGKLFKLEKGIYSDREYVPEYQIVSTKYPDAVFTMDSAFYYHNLTDVIPDRYYLMTDRGASKISDKRVVQIFENSDILYLGAERFRYNGFELLMYSRERMLLELLRKKCKLPFDYYKEIIRNYRKIIHELDMQSIHDMLPRLPKSGMIMEALELEVL
jgi:hypothetical protein